MKLRRRYNPETYIWSAKNSLQWEKVRRVLKIKAFLRGLGNSNYQKGLTITHFLKRRASPCGENSFISCISSKWAENEIDRTGSRKLWPGFIQRTRWGGPLPIIPLMCYVFRKGIFAYLSLWQQGRQLSRCCEPGGRPHPDLSHHSESLANNHSIGEEW